MRNTVRLAKRHGVGVGAHPSLPDLQDFGRREMKIDRDELANCLIYQIGVLKEFLEAEAMKLNHIKAHGSLYGIAARDPEMAHALCVAAAVFKVPLMGMVGTLHETVCLPRTKSGSIEMKSAKDRLSSELAEPLDRPMARRILTQRQMRSQLVVVAGVGRKDLAQMGFAEDDDVIEAFPADRAPISLSACPFCQGDLGAVG